MDSLEIKNLTISYEKMTTPIIEDLSLSLPKGVVIGVVGESGCGKTTLAKAVMGVLSSCGKVENGSININENNLLTVTKKQLKQIQGVQLGIITQESLSSLNPVRKIGSQFIQMICEKTSMDKTEAEKTALYFLDKMNCPKDIMKKYPFQLSGGQRQRVIIAMAFALRPKFLIADEPTTALDVTVQAQVLREMMNLKENYNTGILLISHNFGVVSQVCDEIVVMYKGKIVESGSKDEILNNPSHPYTIALIKSIPDINCDKDKQLFYIPEVEETEEVQGCVFCQRCGLKDLECEKTMPHLVKNHKGVLVACLKSH